MARCSRRAIASTAFPMSERSRMAHAPAALSSGPAKPNGPILKMTGVSKRFPGVRALENVHLEVGQSEIHALLGENGAGKSTLLKILSGAHSADTGEIELFGQPAAFATPHDAQRAGIVTIYQEFTLAPDMTIAENVFIGREPGSRLFISWRRLADETRAITDKIGLKRDPLTLVRDLSVAEQQLVEIARALSMQSRLIIMDEPTSALSEAEVANLVRIIRTLKAEGLSIIFVTHRLEEVFRLCDRYTVLRDGHYVASGRVAETSVDAIIRMMVGRDVGALYGERPIPKHGKVALEVEGLTRRRNARDPNAIELVNVSLKAHHGEILGLAGLVGAGRTETARAIFGADKFDHGVIRVDGKPVAFSSPHDAMLHGIGLVPEDRKKQALFLRLAIRTNITIAAHDQISRGWFIDEGRENALVDEFRRLLSIRMASADQLAGLLSGGNQQKVVLARWLALRPKILIVDEPTRGIDIGSKVEVHNLLIEMAKSGIAVIVISSELPEILAVSDRIVTMREGRVTGEIARDNATQEILMSMMTTHESGGPASAAA
jgi:inositol transport system ATP-binding protein